MIRKIKNAYKETKYLITYPSGLDPKWDAACDTSFEKFLSALYYMTLATMFSYVLLGQAILLMQGYGK